MPRKRKEIVQIIQQATTQQVTTLDLSHCNLNDLLEPICQMMWLTELNLSHAHLSSLPDTIGNLTALNRLILNENQLETLPESISHLTNLQHIDLNRAGYRFAVSEGVMAWLKSIPEINWPDGMDPALEENQQVFVRPDHPNIWLTMLKVALQLYGKALALEDRGYYGCTERDEADASITLIFEHAPELKEILPAFYRDFQDYRFYSSDCASEKTLDGNPFRLPALADDIWRVEVDKTKESPSPLILRDEVDNSSRLIITVDKYNGQEAKVFRCDYGNILISNQPYAEDEMYFADCEAWLY